MTIVGTGLPVAFRHRDGMAAAIIISMADTEASQMVRNPPVGLVTAAGGSTTASGEAGPSMPAFRVADRSSVAAGPHALTPSSQSVTLPPLGNESRRLASIQQAIDGATEGSDPELHGALHIGRPYLERRHHESDNDAATRLAVEFLTARPFVPARVALIELARAKWNLGVALNNWCGEDTVEADEEDEAQQPPS